MFDSEKRGSKVLFVSYTVYLTTDSAAERSPRVVKTGTILHLTTDRVRS